MRSANPVNRSRSIPTSFFISLMAANCGILDVRKFGKFTLLPIEKRDEYEPFKKMGPEPTADFFKLSEFKKDLSKSHRAYQSGHPRSEHYCRRRKYLCG